MLGTTIHVHANWRPLTNNNAARCVIAETEDSLRNVKMSFVVPPA